jgi:hypothetical protein
MKTVLNELVKIEFSVPTASIILAAMQWSIRFSSLLVYVYDFLLVGMIRLSNYTFSKSRRNLKTTWTKFVFYKLSREGFDLRAIKWRHVGETLF